MALLVERFGASAKEVESEVSYFRDWHRGRGHERADWEATWRAWIEHPLTTKRLAAARSEKARPERRDNAPQLSDRQRLWFERFWRVYPSGQRRIAAEREWATIAPDDALAAEIVRAAVIQRTALGFEEEYIPRAVNWLREQRWEDEVESWTPDEDEKEVKAALAWGPPAASHAVWCQGKQYSVPDAGFAAWWSAYPRQLNIDEAWTEWQGLDPDDELHAQLLAELERDKRSDVWERDRRRIPYPHVWLWRESQKRRS